MKALHNIPWNWNDRRRQLLLIVFAITGLMVPGGVAVADDNSPAITQAEVDEIERVIAQAEESRRLAPKVAGTLTCDDDSCRGAYDDIFDHTFLDHKGKMFLFVTTPVVPFLASSSHGCARDSYIVVQLNDEASALKRDAAYSMLTQMQVARALGYEIEIQWTQSNYNPGWLVCKVDILYVYGPASSS